MSLFGGTEVPRRKVGVGGETVRAAQSSGECPGGRMTLREGREEGGRVEVVAGMARDEVGFMREGGPRRVEAAEGGGESFGRGRRDEGRTEGGGIRPPEGGSRRACCVTVGGARRGGCAGRGGGGIEIEGARVGGVGEEACSVDWGVGSGDRRITGVGAASLLVSASWSVNCGTASCGVLEERRGLPFGVMSTSSLTRSSRFSAMPSSFLFLAVLSVDSSSRRLVAASSAWETQKPSHLRNVRGGWL